MSAPTTHRTPGAAPARHDIEGRTDVHDLVVGFYREVVFDPVLHPVFDEVAQTDWSTHIPRLVDYWCQVLLHEAPYDGALMAAHLEVHRRESFRVERGIQQEIRFGHASRLCHANPASKRKGRRTEVHRPHLCSKCAS